MSKKQLKQFIEDLSRAELEDQLLDLYQRFKEVKAFYDFSFDPKEEKLLQEAKFKIGKEYFPEKGKKVRKRRSVAQKLISTYRRLEVNPEVISDISLYAIEVAQAYTEDTPINQNAFYKSMHKSFEQALDYIYENGLEQEFQERINRIVSQSITQHWPESELFVRSTKIVQEQSFP